MNVFSDDHWHGFCFDSDVQKVRSHGSCLENLWVPVS